VDRVPAGKAEANSLIAIILSQIFVAAFWIPRNPENLAQLWGNGQVNFAVSGSLLNDRGPRCTIGYVDCP
jgi:hypothetical protein